MQVKDVMTPHALWTAPETTVAELSQVMLERGVGILPIGADEKLIGMVSDRDVVLRCIAEGKSPLTTTAASIMTESVLYCRDTDSLETVAESMVENKVRRMIVVDENKKLAGIVSLGDLAGKLPAETLDSTLKSIALAA